MENKYIRWKQRFQNYKKALERLSAFVNKRDLNELEQQGLIKAFEYTYELAWNTLKDYYEYQGESGIQGGRDAIQMAFQRGFIENGHAWMDMLADRNRSSHIYNQALASEIAGRILETYFKQFQALEVKLEAIAEALHGLNLPYKFDLSVFHALTDAELLGHIERVGRVFYKRPGGAGPSST